MTVSALPPKAAAPRLLPCLSCLPFARVLKEMAPAMTRVAATSACRVRIERLAREKSPVTADTASRLGNFFGTTPALWANIQSQLDLETAEDNIAQQIRKIGQYAPA
jgi:addiction module HigA family antidote